MSKEIIKLPIKLDGWEVLFNPENQTVSLRQTKPNRIKLSELKPELPDFDNFSLEVCPNVILEVELIKKINHFLSDCGS